LKCKKRHSRETHPRSNNDRKSREMGIREETKGQNTTPKEETFRWNWSLGRPWDTKFKGDYPQRGAVRIENTKKTWGERTENEERDEYREIAEEWEEAGLEFWCGGGKALGRPLRQARGAKIGRT